MEIRKLRAGTIQEATTRVKQALGSDAMILSTRQITSEAGGPLFEIAAIAGGADPSVEALSSLGQVKSELVSLKEMIYLLDRGGGITDRLITNPPAFALYGRLVRSGVESRYARLLLEKAGALDHPPRNERTLRNSAVSGMMKVLQVKDPFAPGRGPRSIAALVGTTGVGKTTTVAKLAARLMLGAGKRVGLISIDTYRIGAMEQLKTYADILGIPCFQAYQKKDLLFAFRRLENKDVILIDTAGQSQYDLKRIEELKEMLGGDTAIGCHLLLSVGTAETEMQRTAANFRPLKFESYIFTKTDEAERIGSILNQVMRTSCPVSYLTTGQNVPDDIEQADPGRIASLLLNNHKVMLNGEKKDGSSHCPQKNR